MPNNKVPIETYLSIDIESDGPIPGENSMLSLGAAAFDQDYQNRGRFWINIHRLPDAKEDPGTMAWWKEHPEAWKNCHAEPIQDAYYAMTSFNNWCRTFENPVFVGYPAGYDFTFVYWYLIKFSRNSPFSFSALDIKTLAFATLGLPWRECVKRNFPKDWRAKEGPKHSHVAADDALEQGMMFCNILKSIRKKQSDLAIMGIHAPASKR